MDINGHSCFKKNPFLFGTPLNLHPLPFGEGRRRFGIANKKNPFLFGTPLNLHYLCTAFSESAGCSAVRLARLLWEQEVPGSNPGTPTLPKTHTHIK